jgi:hypothetical protein
LSHVFGAILAVAGLAFASLSATWLVTGTNYLGVLGQGRTGLRLKRAPAVYFRALGAFGVSFGLIIVYAGVLGAFQLGSASPGIVITLLAWFFASMAWLSFLSYRYRLFRWDVP